MSRHFAGKFIEQAASQFRLQIRRSRIQSLGVFAGERIPRGRKVLKYEGEKISEREARRRLEKNWRRRSGKRVDIFHLNARFSIDGTVGGNGAELINHSCNPNLYARRAKGHILFFSRRPIRKGEELAFDYCLPADAFRVPCKCGAPNCRGTINLKK